jgi:D-3-phosphoglycerate dehydrogenase
MAPVSVLVIGDSVQPARQTGDELRRLLGDRDDVRERDWETGSASGFAGAAYAAESGAAVAIPPSWHGDLATAGVVVTHFFPVGGDLVALAPDLELVATLRTGTENIRPPADRELELLNNPGREADAVSDFAATLILGCLRRVPVTDQAFRRGGWERGVEAAGRPANFRKSTLGLVGFGNIGMRVARKLAGFAIEVLVADPYASADEIRSAGGLPVTLDELLARADVVSLHARLSDETRGLLGREQLAKARQDCWLVNTARAELVDESALVEALDAGRLAGAALDVTWTEPLPSGHPLRDRPNVLITPHIAGSTTTSPEDSVRLLTERLQSWMNSRHPAPETRRNDGR